MILILKRFLFSLVLIGLTALPLLAQQNGLPLPPPTGFVNDYAKVIDAQTKANLETTLKNLKDRAQIELAIVTVSSTGDQDIFDYSLAVARGWGIGAKEGESHGVR